MSNSNDVYFLFYVVNKIADAPIANADSPHARFALDFAAAERTRIVFQIRDSRDDPIFRCAFEISSIFFSAFRD